jgi:hypothetical protein
VYDRILKRDVCLGDKCPSQGHTKLIEVRNGLPVYEYDPTAAERIRQQKSSQTAPAQAQSVSMPSAPTWTSTPRDLTSSQNVSYSTYPSYGVGYANTRTPASSLSTSVGSISQPISQREFLNITNQWISGKVSDQAMIQALDSYIRSSPASTPSAPQSAPPSSTRSTTPPSSTGTSYNRATQSTSFLGTGAQRPQPGFMQRR